MCDLSAEELREILGSAVDRHPDVERHVLLAAARSEGDFGELRREVDRGLRTRRFLDYHESSAWARAAQPVLEELHLAAQTSPSAELLALIERSVGHVVKVIMHADDSNGTIGDLARELLDLHAQVCAARVADPVKLAEWMVRFSCDDQDFFEVDPVRYRAALGESGLAAYRQAIEQRHADGSKLFAVRWARERLAVLDGDTEAIVALLGGDLSAPHQFIAVCEAMAELDREDDVLSFALRGIAETSGWQVDKLYDLACDVHERAGAPVEVLALRRQQHERAPSASTYSTLRRAARRSMPGGSSVPPPDGRCASATAAATSTRFCRRATLTPRGLSQPRTRPGTRAAIAVPASPRHASPHTLTRRSPCTCSSPGKSCSRQAAAHTRGRSRC